MKRTLKLSLMLAAMSAVLTGCDTGKDPVIIDEDDTTEYTFNVSVSGDKQVGYEAGSFDVDVTANVEWTASISGDAAFTINNDGAEGDGVIKVSYTKNTSKTTTRTAIVTIATTAEVATKSYTINITQEVNGETIDYTYTEFYKVSGSQGATSPMKSNYGTYAFDGHSNEITGSSLASANFTLTFGSGDATHMRIGANAGNYDYCTLDSYKTGVDATGLTYEKAAGLFNRTLFSTIGKVKVVGQYDEAVKLALVYSTDNTTWTLHSDGLHTPTQTGTGTTDEYEFVLSAPVTGYFGVIMVGTASSDARRIQNAVVTYYTAQ